MDMSLSRLLELVMDREALAFCSPWGRKESGDWETELTDPPSITSLIDSYQAFISIVLQIAFPVTCSELHGATLISELLNLLAVRDKVDHISFISILSLFRNHIAGFHGHLAYLLHLCFCFFLVFISASALSFWLKCWLDHELFGLCLSICSHSTTTSSVLIVLNLIFCVDKSIFLTCSTDKDVQ